MITYMSLVFFFLYILQNSDCLHLAFQKYMLPVFNFQEILFVESIHVRPNLLILK